MESCPSGKIISTAFAAILLVPGSGTVRTEIIGHHAKTLELPLLVRSVSQLRAERESSHRVFPPNPEGEILDVLAPCPIISVLTVSYILFTSSRATSYQCWNESGPFDMPQIPWYLLLYFL